MHVIKRSIDQLNDRVVRVLKSHGVTEVEQLLTLYPEGLLRLQGFGFKALRHVEAEFLNGEHYDPSDHMSKKRAGTGAVIS